MSGRTRRGPSKPSRPRVSPPPSLPPLPLRHPAFLFATLIAAVCVVVSASYLLYDTDLWSLLVVGKTIWAEHALPHTDLWTWRHYGEPQVVSSWLFRALLWPLWSAAGIGGITAWRWAAVLATFGLSWATARTLGARGLLALVVLVWCALIYRIRTDIRPETLATLLFALELWILERRRARPTRAAWGIVPIVWVWTNAHISYYLAFVLLAIYLADTTVARWRGRASDRPDSPRELWWVAIAAAAVAFLNPYGWRVLAQPFQFALFWRNDPMFKTIGELVPPVWSENLRNGLPLLLAGWPVLASLRWRRRRLDLAELLACGLLTAIAFTSQRFLGIYVVAAAPFVARDLSEWTAGWQSIARPWPRAAAMAAAMVGICVADWRRPDLPLRIGILDTSVPIHASDFIATHGVRGRGFNEFHFGGYQAYRFWPDRTRLPFMSTQPEHATAEDRALVTASDSDPEAWRALDDRYHFDYLLLTRNQSRGSQLLDHLDRDTTWTMVFADDAAEVLVRRGGPLRPVAEAFGYRVLPAGREARELLVSRAAQDPELRRRAIAELARAAASSPDNGSAEQLLGILTLMDGRRAEARRHLESALARKPWLPRVHEMLGWIALDEHRPHDAIRELRTERRLHDPPRGLDLKLGQAHQQLGDLDRAKDAYRREVERDPGNPEARDSLTALESR